jgi:hypothetical protein
MTAQRPPLRLDVGTAIHCSDGALGELADIVIDPTTRRVTHIVVKPHHTYQTARLVPIALIRRGRAAPIVIDCSLEEAGRLEHAEEMAYLRLGEFPVDDPQWDIQVTEMLALPYYEGIDLPSSGITTYGQGVDVHYDRVPKGEVEIGRHSAVASCDAHHLGHVDGLLTDGEHASHIVLERGHLWGKREIAIPIGAVDRVDSDGVVLAISKDDVEQLEPVRVHRWF